MSIASNITELDNLRKGLATKLTNKGVTASQTEGFETLVPKVDNIPAPVYNASREWSAAHPTYDNAEDILANYTAGICYIFLGAVKITIPTNGTHYYTKDGEVAAGTEVQLTCAEGKDTCWLMEEWESGSPTANASVRVLTMVGLGVKGVRVTTFSSYLSMTANGAWGLKLIWLINNGHIYSPSTSNLNNITMCYIDSTSSLTVQRYQYAKCNYVYGLINVGGNYAFGYSNCHTLSSLSSGNYTLVGFGYQSTTRVFEFPNANHGNAASYMSSWQYRLQVGKLTSFNTTLIPANATNLCDFEVGEGTDINLPMTTWTCTVVTSDRNASILLISNTRRHILDKVADHTGEGLVRTITCGWVGTLSESEDEEIATALEDLMTDFAEKGWTLQG